MSTDAEMKRRVAELRERGDLFVSDTGHRVIASEDDGTWSTGAIFKHDLDEQIAYGRWHQTQGIPLYMDTDQPHALFSVLFTDEAAMAYRLRWT